MSANTEESAAYHTELATLGVWKDVGYISQEEYISRCAELQNAMFASLPMIVCAYHQKHFGAPLVMQEGDASKISHRSCSDCEAIELAAVEAYHAARREAV